LTGGRVTERFDCFAGTPVEEKVRSDRRPQGVNFFARKDVNLEAT
jgi:hypothetical protein